MRTPQFVILATLVGCTPGDRIFPTDPEDPAIAAGTESQVGDPFTLSPGEERSIPSIGLVVRFVEVAADHRCPVDVDCVWEGDAEVVVNALQDGEERTFNLHTPRDVIGPTAAEVPSGHRLELLGLEPQPVSDRDTPPGEYRATFRVSVAQG